MYLSEKSFHGGGLFTPTHLEEDHEDFDERIRKTLYYGKLPGTDRPSLPVTDLMVDFYNDAAPRKLGKLDNYLAASTVRSACVSPSATVVGMMYVKRLKSRRPEYLTQVSSSELFLISMMMASKFLYDEGVDDEVFNDEWANSGDLETEDVNQLEVDFLSAIDWNLFVRNDDFSKMLQNIEQRVALKQGMERGWFTYTDLYILTQNMQLNWQDLTLELSTVFSATTLAYLAGFLTMLGSTMLGTTTSLALINAGSAIVPLVYRMTPTLYPALTLNVMDSRSHLDFPRAEVMEENGTKFATDLGLDNQLLDDSVSFVEENETSDLDPQSNVKVTNREQGALFNGFLSPFLALVTLKDTLFNFAYGVGLPTESDDVSEINDLDLDAALTSPNLNDLQEFCSSGPCLLDSWKNCWNVTISSDWTLPNSNHGNHVPDLLRCCPRCESSNDINSHSRKAFDSFPNSEIIHCCCNLGHQDDRWLRSTLPSTISDLNLRFATRSVYPGLVTT